MQYVPLINKLIVLIKLDCLTVKGDDLLDGDVSNLLIQFISDLVACLALLFHYSVRAMPFEVQFIQTFLAMPEHLISYMYM